jgi:glutathione synthase/RimK-type ligase-like ATP-grasp enzyme
MEGTNLPRVAIATSLALADLHPDERTLVPALDRAGVEAEAAVWNNPNFDWSRYDAVLMRSVWDYFERYAEFLDWLALLERVGVPTINALPVIRWNSDKRYLVEIERAGVPIVPTAIVPGADLDDALAMRRGEELVVKPTVSGTAWHTVRGTCGRDAFADAVSKLPRAFEYLVQPFVPEIATEGEWSTIWFDGALSHAVLKRPREGDYRVQSEYGGTSVRREPPPHVRDASSHALGIVERLGYEAPAYARIDGVVVGGSFLVMELELIEPYLHFPSCPEAADRLATAVAKRALPLPA